MRLCETYHENVEDEEEKKDPSIKGVRLIKLVEGGYMNDTQ